MYIDDILVVSKSWEIHLCHLRALLEVLNEAGLTCKRSKCVFGKRRLTFLEHEIGDGVVRVPEARVHMIEEHLHGALCRYSAQKLKCLGVMESIHRGLESLRSGRQLNRRVHGWTLNSLSTTLR